MKIKGETKKNFMKKQGEAKKIFMKIQGESKKSFMKIQSEAKKIFMKIRKYKVIVLHILVYMSSCVRSIFNVDSLICGSVYKSS
jgi:hypothetical protein